MSDFTDIRGSMTTEPLKQNNNKNPNWLSMSRTPAAKYFIPKAEVEKRMFMPRIHDEPFIPKKEKQVSKGLFMPRMPTLRMPTFNIPKLMITNTDNKFDAIRKSSKISMNQDKKILEIEKKIDAIRKDSKISEDNKTVFIQILKHYKNILQDRRKYNNRLETLRGKVDDKIRMTYIGELKNIKDEIGTKEAILYNLDLQIGECEKLLTYIGNIKKGVFDSNPLEDLKAKLEVLKALEIAYHYKVEFNVKLGKYPQHHYFINFILARADVCIEKLKKSGNTVFSIFNSIYDYGKLTQYLNGKCAMPLTILNTDELLMLFPQLVEMLRDRMMHSSLSIVNIIKLLVELNTILEILKKNRKVKEVETFKKQFKELIDEFIPLYKKLSISRDLLGTFLTVEDLKNVIYTVDNLKRLMLDLNQFKDLFKNEILTVSDLIMLLDKGVLTETVLKELLKDYDDVLSVEEILSPLKKRGLDDINYRFKKLLRNVLNVEDFKALLERKVLTVEDLTKLNIRYSGHSNKVILDNLEPKLTAVDLLGLNVLNVEVLIDLFKHKVLTVEVLKEFYYKCFGKENKTNFKLTIDTFIELLKHNVLTVEDLNKILTKSSLKDLKNLYDNIALSELLDRDLKYLEKILKDINQIYESSSDDSDGEKSSGGRKAKPSPIKKMVCGKLRCIYKIHGSRKEHLKYKGRLITVAEYRKLMKA